MTSPRLPLWCYLLLLVGSMLCRAASLEPAPSRSGQPAARAEAWTALAPNLGDTYAMDLPFAWHTAAVRRSGVRLLEHGEPPFDWLPDVRP